MRKLIILLLIMFLLYLGIQIGFKFFDKGYTMNYEIKKENTFQVKEIYSQNKENEHNNYYFEITVNGTTFGIQTYQNLNRLNKIIEDVEYFKNGNYECIYPITKTKEIISDVICKNDVYYYYHSIKGQDSELDNFVVSLKEKGYVETLFEDTMNKINYSDVIVLYDNIPKNIYLGIEYYKGIYSMNQKLSSKKIQLFKKDVYNKSISAFTDEYYIVADYDQEYEFHDFYLVNLETYKYEKITSNKAISFDSYVQGVVDNSIYIFDRSSKKQYELDVKTKTVIEVGNTESNIKYYNRGTWEEKSAYDASSSNIIFNHYQIENEFQGTTYSRIDKIGNVASGFYYLYQYQNGVYRVYRANVQNLSLITYLFSTDTIDNIAYVDDQVYYKNSTKVKYYQDLVGEKTILEYNELQFNKTLQFGVD